MIDFIKWGKFDTIWDLANDLEKEIDGLKFRVEEVRREFMENDPNKKKFELEWEEKAKTIYLLEKKLQSVNKLVLWL